MNIFMKVILHKKLNLLGNFGFLQQGKDEGAGRERVHQAMKERNYKKILQEDQDPEDNNRPSQGQPKTTQSKTKSHNICHFPIGQRMVN